MLTIGTLTGIRPLNRRIFGVNSPSKELDYAGSAIVTQRFKDARIPFARVGGIQQPNYHTSSNWASARDWTPLDNLIAVFDNAGTEIMFEFTGWPKGIAAFDWTAYAAFMADVVKRYPQITYYEVWNEPTDEPDGKLDMQQYQQLTEIVGGAMKAANPGIKLVGPAAPWADLGPNGWPGWAAQTLGNLLDVISLHDYGSQGQSGQTLLDNTSRYATELQPRWGKPLALTEWNMCAFGAPLPWHQPYNAVYAATSLIRLYEANADHANYFTTGQAGGNLLGMLDPASNYAGDSVYQLWSLIGNHLGDTFAGTAHDGRTDALLTLTGNEPAILLVNRDVSATAQVSVAWPAGLAACRAYALDGTSSIINPSTITLAPLQMVMLTVDTAAAPATPTPTTTPPIITPTPQPIPAPDPTGSIPTLPTGTVIVDNCTSLAHLVDPSGVGIDTTNPQYVGANIRINRVLPGVQSATWSVPDAIAAQFTVHVLQASVFGGFTVESSADGTTFAPVETTATIVDAGNEQHGTWQTTLITAISLPAGTQFVRIVWPDAANGMTWDGQISQVSIVSAPPVVAPPPAPAPTPMTLADLLAYATVHGFTGVETALDGTPLLVIRAA